MITINGQDVAECTFPLRCLFPPALTHFAQDAGGEMLSTLYYGPFESAEPLRGVPIDLFTALSVVRTPFI
jgi:hypothetical protein